MAAATGTAPAPSAASAPPAPKQPRDVYLNAGSARKDIEIGKGTFSTVYRWILRQDGRYCAAKSYTPEAIADPVLQALKRNEVAAHGKIPKHDHLVQLIESFNEGTAISHIVYEFCNGGSLETILQKPEHFFGLPQTEVILIMKHLTNALNALRQSNLIHCNITPKSILLTITKNGDHFYKLGRLCDLNECKDKQSVRLRRIPSRWAHPEVITVFKDARSPYYGPDMELWSVGLLIYTIAAGSCPFPIEEPNYLQLVQHLPAGMIAYNSNGYVDNLPDSSSLTVELKNSIANMLKNLFIWPRHSQNQPWTFQKFFEESLKITEKIYLEIIDTKNVTMHSLALDQNNKFEHLLGAVANKVNIAEGRLLLLLKDLFLHKIIDPNKDISDYEVKFYTTFPILVVDVGLTNDTPIVFVDAKLPVIKDRIKELKKVVIECERKLLKIVTICGCLKQAVQPLLNHTQEKIFRDRTIIKGFQSTFENLVKRFNSSKVIYQKLFSEEYQSDKDNSCFEKLQRTLKQVDMSYDFLENHFYDASYKKKLPVLMNDKTHEFKSRMDSIKCEFKRWQDDIQCTDELKDIRAKKMIKELQNLLERDLLPYAETYYRAFLDILQQIKQAYELITELPMHQKQLEENKKNCEKLVESCMNTVKERIEKK